MTNGNHYNRQSTESSLNLQKVTIVLTIIFFAGIISWSFFSSKSCKIQEIKIHKSNLKDTIPALAVIAQEDRTAFPEGIVEAVQTSGKDEFMYGTILSGRCNQDFSTTENQLAYQKTHPNDVIWLEHLGDKYLKLWVFLEKGTFPDKNFFKIID